MLKQHQHGGPVGNNGAAGANGGGGGSGPPGSSGGGGGNMGQTPSGAESHVHSAGGLPARDCWSHQPPASHQHHHVAGRGALPDSDHSPPRRDVVDDDDDEPTKKPLHLLQLQTAMTRFTPPEHGHHHHAGSGTQLKGVAASYRVGSPTSLHPVPAPSRYHHTQHGTPMGSPLHAWPDSATSVDMLPPGLQQQQQQQQRIQAASNQTSPYPSSVYMMTSSDMTATYQSWYPGSAQSQLQQPPHHLSTLLS